MKPPRSLEFDPAAFDDLAWWIEQDRKALRIIKLIEAIQRVPFAGIGESEPLKHEFAVCWSRRTTTQKEIC